MHTRQYLALGLIFLPLLTGCGKASNLLAAEKSNDRPALESRLKQLLAGRVNTAQGTRAAAQAAFEAETVSLGDLVIATDNLWKAELALANSSSEIIAAHKHHVEHFRQTEQKIEALYATGTRGGEAEKYGTARFNRESAEIELLEACIGTGQAYPTFDAALDLPAKAAPFNP